MRAASRANAIASNPARPSPIFGSTISFMRQGERILRHLQATARAWYARRHAGVRRRPRGAPRDRDFDREDHAIRDDIIAARHPQRDRPARPAAWHGGHGQQAIRTGAQQIPLTRQQQRLLDSGQFRLAPALKVASGRGGTMCRPSSRSRAGKKDTSKTTHPRSGGLFSRVARL